MKRLNWNEVIKVKLTDLGKDIFYHQYDYLNKNGINITPTYPVEDEEGFCKFQLWRFIQIYGTHIGMGFPNVIEDISFYIDEDNLENL